MTSGSKSNIIDLIYIYSVIATKANNLNCCIIYWGKNRCSSPEYDSLKCYLYNDQKYQLLLKAIAFNS